jgi:hypothetical protein
MERHQKKRAAVAAPSTASGESTNSDTLPQKEKLTHDQ